MTFSSVPGIILWDRNVSGQEQEKSGREDLFLDLEQGEEDTRSRRIWFSRVTEDEKCFMKRLVQQFTPGKWNVIFLHCTNVKKWHQEGRKVLHGLQNSDIKREADEEENRNWNKWVMLFSGCHNETAGYTILSNYLIIYYYQNSPVLSLQLRLQDH